MVAVEVHQANASRTDLGLHLEIGVTVTRAGEEEEVVIEELTTAGEEASIVTIRGRVTNPDGRPANRARVVFSRRDGTADDPPRTQETDFLGNYLFFQRLEASGQDALFSIKALRENYESLAVEVTPGGDVRAIDLALRDFSLISGQVLALNGRPLSSVVVRARPGVRPRWRVADRGGGRLAVVGCPRDRGHRAPGSHLRRALERSRSRVSLLRLTRPHCSLPGSPPALAVSR